MKLAHHSRSVLVGVLAAGSLWANAAQSAPDSEPQKQQGNAESEQRDSGLESGEATLSELLIEAKAIEQRRSYTDSRLIMPNETLEKFGEASLGDALRRTPSIQMGDRPGEGRELQFRGLEPKYTQVLFNGEQVLGEDGSRIVEVDRIPTELVESVQVNRTSRPELEGGGITGQVDIQFKDVPDSGETVSNWEAAVGHTDGDLGGTNGLLSGTYGENTGDFAYLISANVDRQERPRRKKERVEEGGDIETEDMTEPKQFDNRSILGNVQWKLSDQDALLYKSKFSESEVAKNRTKRISENGVFTETDTRDEDIERSRYSLGTEWQRRPDNGNELDVSIAFSKVEVDEFELNEVFDASGNFDEREDEPATIEKDQIRGAVDYRFQLTDSHRISLGALAKDQDYDQSASTIEKDSSGNVINVETEGGENFNLNEERFDLYVKDDYRWGDQTQLMFGFRGEYLRRSGEVKNSAGSGDTSTQFEPLPSFNILHDLDEENQLRLGIARHIRRPALPNVVDGVVEREDGTEDEPDKVGNPELDNEQAWAFELGWEHYFSDDSGLIGVNLFHRELEDKIESGPTFEQPDGRIGVKKENVGDGWLQGVEFEYNRNLVVYNVPNLTLRGDASIFDSELEENETGIKRAFAKQPDYTAGVGFDYDIPGINLTVGTSANFIGEAEWSQPAGGGVRESVTVESHERLDAYVSMDLSEDLSLSLSGQNLLETEIPAGEQQIDTSTATVEENARETEFSERMLWLSLEGRF
jgi:iron complex outermembrane receptor protein